ncbi:PREDICTED: probable phytol kinase 2, chloroplastic isoform X4 [Brassica oleracea var. oleracea]|uniref:probable phytol kinase 2, chloroplastic isoform X4 n=1 Tax=Brassica oleracea var. oleracea TaxID=109376 RepID=UPI0006A71649|nr:PREDICTED: probable phytol kinase 2, chloroplastic isoform X4 [Brassica oleracea var. oleracea]
MYTKSFSLILSSPLIVDSPSSSSSLAVPCFFSPTSLKPSSASLPATYFHRYSHPRSLTSSLAALMSPENSVLSDVCATGISGVVAFSCLGFWGEIGKRGIFDQKLIRKLVHINIGLVFILCWPLFSSGLQGALFASLIPGLNIIRMLLLGLGVYQDEGTIKSMSRHGDRRELLKGPLYYALSITSACIFYWKTSPIAIAVVCNLCAGDGMADIVGRRLGTEKLPYNRNKSVAGSIGMAIAGFLASVAYMYYFASFGYIENSGWDMILRFFIISVASALVESLPISTDIDDNLTVSLTSALVGTLLF